MKKIVLLIMLVLFTMNVNAKTYYSDYSQYKLVDKKVEKTDTIDVKIEKKYLIYKENKTEAFYPSYMEIEDMIKTGETKIVTSSWLDEKPNELIGRTIIEKNLYEYQNMKKIRYLKLTNLVNSKDYLHLTELSIFNGATKLDYEIKSNLKDINNIKDNDLTNYAILDEEDEIIIDLKENIDITDLAMMYHFHITTTSDIYFTMELYGEEFENVYARRTIYSPVNINDFEYPSYLIDEDHFNIENPLYDEKQISETKIRKTNFNIVNLVTKYKTEDLYIKYEKTDREYLDDYYGVPIDGYELDLDSIKEFYYIRTRDKVEISDELIIKNYDTKLEDFIKCTTTDDIKITSNMNYYKNGTYDINFILPFKTIKEKLIVDISENYIKALEVQNNYLKSLEEENKKLVINNNKLNSEIKEILINKDKSVNEVNDKIIECRYELDELKKNNQDLGQEITEEKNYTILIVIPIMLILIILLLYLRKKSIQNNN